MKTTFLAKRKALFSRENITWGSVAMAVAIVAVLLRIFAPDTLTATINPIIKMFDSVSESFHIVTLSFKDISAVMHNNEKLEKQISSLSSENAILSEKLSSINLLGTDQINSARTGNFGILSAIIARPPTSPYDSLLVSSGADLGVVEGMLAFGPGGVPLGFVSTVERLSSRVLLYSAPGRETDGWVGKDKFPIKIIGRGAGVFEALTARTDKIEEGDFVYVAPGGLAMGKILRIDSDPVSPSLTLRIQSIVNIFSITWIELHNSGL